MFRIINEITIFNFNKNYKIYLLIVFSVFIGLISCLTGIWAIVIIAGAIFFLITLLNPKFGIFILLFLQLGLTQSAAGVNKIEIIFMIFFGTVVVSWVLHQLLKKEIAISWSSLNFPILLFLAFCVFSFIKASYNNVSIMNWFAEWRVFLILILFFIILNEFKSKEELKWLIYSFLLITTSICLRDIFLVIQQGGLEQVRRVAGLQYASFFFIMAIPFSISIFLTTKRFLVKWLQIPLILLFIYRLLISIMRSYILTLLVMLVIFVGTLLVLKTFKNKRLFFRMVSLIILVCIISGVVFLVFPVQMDRIVKNTLIRFSVLKDFSSPQNISAFSRVAEIKAVWNYAIKQPVLGHGFGFKYQYYRPNQKFYDVPYVHFIPLFFFLKVGFIGILLIIWIIIQVLSLNWQVFKNEKDLFWKFLELALFSNFIGFVILSFFITNVIRIDSLFYFTLATGIIVTIKKIQKESNTITMSRFISLNKNYG